MKRLSDDDETALDATKKSNAAQVQPLWMRQLQQNCEKFLQVLPEVRHFLPPVWTAFTFFFPVRSPFRPSRSLLHHCTIRSIAFLLEKRLWGASSSPQSVRTSNRRSMLATEAAKRTMSAR
jgi:hypothetical protein